MDFQGGIMSRLLADPTVSGLVGTRISWMDRPQEDQLPAISLQVISDPRPTHLKGFDGARYTLIQCDCWAERYETTVAMGRAVIAALKNPATIDGKKFGNALVEGQRDLGEEPGSANDRFDIFLHRQSVDLRIWHAGD